MGAESHGHTAFVLACLSRDSKSSARIYGFQGEWCIDNELVEYALALLILYGKVNKPAQRRNDLYDCINKNSLFRKIILCLNYMHKKINNTLHLFENNLTILSLINSMHQHQLTHPQSYHHVQKKTPTQYQMY
jgi:hypothetical protein